MAEVTGPISTLPGTRHDLPQGTCCDEHSDRPAVARVQGETDSFGCEMYDLCQECLDEYRAECAAADTSGRCDWCKQNAPRLRSARDYEEGMCGPVYEVCDACIKRRDDRIEAELDAYDDYVDEDFDDWDDE